MSSHSMSLEKLPWWSWLAPVLAFGLLGLEFAHVVHVAVSYTHLTLPTKA